MILGSIFNGIMARVQNRRAEDEQKKALEVLKQEEEELDNIFKSNYYSDYLHRADVQNLINSAKEMFQSNTNNMQGRAAIMGATDEWRGATQNTNNKALSSLYSNLAAQGVNWKDRVLDDYLNRKSNINTRQYNTYFNNSNNYQVSSNNFLSEIGDNIKRFDNTISGIAQGGILKKLGF